MFGKRLLMARTTTSPHLHTIITHPITQVQLRRHTAQQGQATCTHPPWRGMLGGAIPGHVLKDENWPVPQPQLQLNRELCGHDSRDHAVPKLVASTSSLTP